MKQTTTTLKHSTAGAAEDRDKGSSIPLLDPYVRLQIAAICPRSIVDCGAGKGRMGELCRQELGRNVHITAVEGYQRGIQPLIDEGIYDRVLNSLIEDWVETNTTQFDLAIFGDVLEHVPRRNCFAIVRSALSFAKNVIVNVPLRNLDQGVVRGNPLEEHKAYLTERCFDKRFEIREKHVATADVGYVKLNMWIVGYRRWSLREAKRRLRDFLLIHGGRRAKSLIDR